MKNNQKGITPIIIALIVAVIFGGGYLIVRQQGKNSPKVENTTVSTTTATNDWKTYTNEKYGFEIKYPPYLSLKASGRPDQGTSFINNNKNLNIAWVSISLYMGMKGGITFDEASQGVYEEANLGYEKGGVVRILKNFTIDNKRALTYEGLGYPSKIPNITTYIEDNEESIIFEIYGQREINTDTLNQNDFSEYSDFEAISNQMLSTFKFTTPSAITTTDWKTYKDEKVGIEFEYPSLLSVKQDGETITLSHSIAYKHADPCDFKGDAPELNNLSDFNVSFKIADQNLKDLVQSSTYPGWDYVSKNPFKLGSLNGFKVNESIEGCGKDVYYFTLSPTKTLVIDRSFTEFNQGISILPGVINPGQSDKFFERIISTFKFTK